MRLAQLFTLFKCNKQYWSTLKTPLLTCTIAIALFNNNKGGTFIRKKET